MSKQQTNNTKGNNAERE